MNATMTEHKFLQLEIQLDCQIDKQQLGSEDILSISAAHHVPSLTAKQSNFSNWTSSTPKYIQVQILQYRNQNEG